MSNNINQLLKQLNLIYEKLPPVPCFACGKCCVSPTITFIEFIYLLDGICEDLSMESIQKFLFHPAIFHTEYEGNLICRFLDTKGRCQVHKSRSMACRLHGLPVISKLNINNLENCQKMDPNSLPNVELKKLQEWLDELSSINSQLYEYYEEPFWIAGFNIECWFSVMYDPMLNFGPFKTFKNILSNRYKKIQHLEYNDKTNLKEKVDKITMFNEFSKTGIGDGLVNLLDSIINDYPQTGTYFLDEANMYKKAILKNQSDGDT